MDQIEAIYYLYFYSLFYKKVLDKTGHGFMPEIIYYLKININICYFFFIFFCKINKKNREKE